MFLTSGAGVLGQCASLEESLSFSQFLCACWYTLFYLADSEGTDFEVLGHARGWLLLAKHYEEK